MSKNTKDVVEDKDYSLERVPVTARKGFWPMFFIMLGFTFFSASMSVGAKLGIGLNLQGFIWAMCASFCVQSVLCAIFLRLNILQRKTA